MSIIWIAFEVIINFYEGFMETYFIYKFLPPKTESTKKNIIAFALCFCTLGLLITVMNYLTIFEGILGIVCYLTALFLYALVNRKGSIIKKLFAATVPLVMISLISIITLNFVSSVNSMSIKEIVTESGFARFTVLIFTQALFFISVKLMLKLLATTSENFNAVEWIAIILILAISIIMMFLLHLIAIDSTQRLYINLLILTIVAVNIIIFYMIDSISVKNNQKKELELLKLQEQYSHQYIENASQKYDSIRKIRHDLKDQLSAVYTMIAQGHADESMKYIEKYVNVISISESFVNTDNYIVNAIINSKFAVAATEGIRTNCSCIKSFDGIDDIDMLHILSNTLDNAITASEKITDESERFINLDISKTMDIYRIVVRNAINESVLKRNPSLKTTKLNAHKHGWGIKIIREIAEKYQGRCEFYESDKMFTCLITLKSTLL